jgi:hypothetical protein
MVRVRVRGIFGGCTRRRLPIPVMAPKRYTRYMRGVGCAARAGYSPCCGRNVLTCTRGISWRHVLCPQARLTYDTLLGSGLPDPTESRRGNWASDSQALEAASASTLDALSWIRSKAEEAAGVGAALRCRAVATAAVREAGEDVRRFLAARVEALLGCPLEVLSGERGRARALHPPVSL